MLDKISELLLKRYRITHPIARRIIGSVTDFKVEKYYNMIVDNDCDILSEKDKYKYNNELEKQKSPRLILINHSNCHDFPVIMKTLDRHFFVLSSTTNFRGIEGAAIKFSGSISVDRTNADSCRKADAAISNYLLKGSDVLVMIEGTWNLSDSLPMLPFKWGSLITAQKLGIDVVPIILEYDYTSKKCMVNIGKSMKLKKEESNVNNYNLVRDTMATLRWNLWHLCSQINKNKMTKEEFIEYKNMLINEYTGFDEKLEEQIVYKPNETWENVSSSFRHK